MIVALVAGVAVVGAYGVIEWSARRSRRANIYERAIAHAALVGRPLLVIGDPGGGWTHNDYGYGDVCVDLTGCPGAPPLTRAYAIDLSTDAIPLASDSHVVLAVYTLESVPDIAHAWGEVMRVAGAAEHVFNLSIEPWELAAHTYPSAQWVVTSSPPAGPFAYEPIERRAVIAMWQSR